MKNLWNLFRRGGGVSNGLRKAVDLSFCYAKFKPDGELVDCNENFAHLFKYEKPTEIIGKHHRLFVDENYRESSAYQNFWQELAEGKTQKGEFFRKNRLNEEVYIQAAYTPIKNASDRVESVIKIASNITDSKVLAKNAQGMKGAVDRSFAYIKFNPEGHILEANNIFINLMQYGHVSEIVGKHHSIFAAPTYAESEDYQNFWKDLRSGQIQAGEFHRVTKNGNDVWLQASYSPIKNSHGEVESIVKIATDITSKVLTFKDIQGLQDTIDLSFGFIKFDTSGNITDVNTNFHNLLGYSRAEVIGKHHSMFVDDKYANSQAYSDFWANLNKGITQRGEFERLSKDKSKIWIQAAYTPIMNDYGQVESVMKIAADITETKMTSVNAKQLMQDEVLLNINEIVSGISEIATGARTQAQKTDESSEKIEIALESSSDVAQKAETIYESTLQAVSNSEEGEKLVTHLVETMDSLNAVADVSQQSMNELAKGSEQISNALKVIQEIASQTNLLALNAAIEAAQAGDAGRGFGVIAGEVRDLAERSKQSAKQIEMMIASIQKDTSQVSKAMNDVTSKVKEGGEESQKVSTIFQKMSASSKEASELSNQILAASAHQKNEIKGIVKNIESIVVVANQTAAGSEEVASAAKALEERIENF